MTIAADTGLLRTILERPHDDAGRLIYADWLDDQGEAERSEFIRVQCELACLSGANCGGYYCNEQVGHIDCADPFGVKAGELRRRERALWKSLGESFDVCGIESRMGWESGIDQEDRIAIGRRGFVDEVRCRLADWIGTECPDCNGYGGNDPDALDTWDCRTCNKTGRVGAHGPAIVACQPVTRVVLTDKAPTRTASGWAWWRFVGLEDTDTLPQVVFDSLPMDDAIHYPNERLCYRTQQAAIDALSAALIRWARQAAGLPPLPS